jgi:hypothetical protein
MMFLGLSSGIDFYETTDTPDAIDFGDASLRGALLPVVCHGAEERDDPVRDFGLNTVLRYVKGCFHPSKDIPRDAGVRS